MIKKCLGLLCTLGLILLPSFSSAWNNLHQVGVGENLGQNNYCIIDSNLSFQCSLSDNVLISQNENRSIAYFRLSNGLGIYQMDNYNMFYGQGIMTGFQFCTYDFSNVSDISNLFGDGFYWSSCLGRVYSYQEFKEYASTHQLQSRGFLSNAGDFGFGGPVFVFEDGAFRATADSLNGDLKVYYGTYYTHNFGLTGMALSADFSDLLIFGAPITNSTNTTTITDNDYIDYYQNNPNYNFTADMCWIGTTDLTGNYGENVAFHQWSGYNIYQFYSQLYGTTFKLSDLDTWLNSWLVNFNTFFKGFNRYSDGTPYYVLRYNGIDDLVIDKTNLTNPFIDNKIAYYFMASNICDSVSDCSNISQELAIYCYKSLNIKNNNNYNITYNPNQNLENNVSQWVINKYNSQSFYWSGNVIINSEDFHGTAFDYFGGDDFTGDFQGFFSGSFDKLKDSFGNITNSDLGLGVLPSYIVMFLLALILFRFLSH